MEEKNILSSVHLVLIDLTETILAASCDWLCIAMIVGNGVMPELYHVYCTISLYIAYSIPSQYSTPLIILHFLV